MAHWLSLAQGEARSRPLHSQYPWERGFLGVVFGARDPLELRGHRGVDVSLRVEPALQPPAQTAPEAAAEGASEWQPGSVCPTTRIPRLKGTQPVEEDQRRGLAVSRWRWVLEVAGPAAALYRQTTGQREEAMSRALVDACYSKSVNTLRKRACAISMYMEWAGGREGFPFIEDVVYAYVTHLKQEGAPATRASSFLEAARFSSALLGIPMGEGATTSARVAGAVLASYDRKRATRQAPPFETSLVKALEVVTRTARDAADRTVAGFALFVLLSRSRLSDAARADGEPELDLYDQGKGYVEVRTTGLRVKTGRGKRRRLRLMPVVANATGLTGKSWAKQRLAARRECGQSVADDGCLRQSLGPMGFRQGTVMGTTEVVTHVRRLLRAMGAPGAFLRDKTSHSLKATCLSWAAKAGLPLAERRVLGGHALPGDVSVLEYSRDALASLLRSLDGVIEKIRAGAFQPDQTRSGRWTVGEPEGDAESEAPTEGKQLFCPCGSTQSAATRYRYKRADIQRCTDCGSLRAAYGAWTEE